MKEGLYRASYGHARDDEQTGYTIFRSGHVYSFNDFQAYTGAYEMDGAAIRGTLWLKEEDRQARHEAVEIRFSGTFVADTLLINGAATDAGAPSFKASLFWIAP